MLNFCKLCTAGLLLITIFDWYGCSKSSDNIANPSGSTGTQKTITIVVPMVDTPKTSVSLNTNATYVAAHDSIVAGGDVYYDGGASVTARGVCWSTSQNPTIANNKTINGSGTGFFKSPFGHLLLNTTYYIRAYATNSAGTGYSPQQHLTTAYKIGEHSQGGIIFYIDQTNLHGLVVSANDLSDAPWENVTFTKYFSVGAYSITDGDGNTTLIIKYFGNTGNAAAVAKSCRDGGFTDWFLPASDQLNTLFNSRFEINGNFGIGATYWSSTETTNNISWAFATPWQYGDTFAEVKVVMHSVRAIRAF